MSTASTRALSPTTPRLACVPPLTSTSRARHLVILLVAGLLALTGCTGEAPDSTPRSESTSAATPTTPPPEPDAAPKAGSCHRLGWDDAVSPVAPADDASPCGRPHTSQTYFVGTLPESVEVDDTAAADHVERACTRRFAAHVGATARELRLTMLQPVWFTPDLEQADLGADWFRCDVVAVAADETLARLPKRTKGIAGQDAVAMCGTAQPGTPKFRRVTCSRAHAWRAAASVDLDFKKYPSAEQARSAMADACRSTAADTSADPLEFRWSEERPTRAQWRAGRRHGLCWVPTSD